MASVSAGQGLTVPYGKRPAGAGRVAAVRQVSSAGAWDAARKVNRLRRTAVLLVIGCLAAVAVAGCGSSKSSSSSATSPASTTTTTHLAKTKFVFHAALAFGAFHHYIYLPARAGDLTHPLSHKLTVVKAALAALFTYHELKLAAQDVKSSKLLSKLFAPITIVAAKIRALDNEIKGGHTSSSSVEGINSSLGSIKSTAASNGQGFSDQVPSASQLAAGVVH